MCRENQCIKLISLKKIMKYLRQATRHVSLSIIKKIIYKAGDLQQRKNIAA
jgi:hypothetical protein